MLWQTLSMAAAAAAASFAKMLKQGPETQNKTQHQSVPNFCMGFVLVLFVCKALGFLSTRCREDCIHTCRLQYTLSFANLPEPLQPGIADQVLVPFHKTMIPPVPCGGEQLPGEAAGSCNHLFYWVIWFSVFPPTLNDFRQPVTLSAPVVFFGSTLQTVILVLWNIKSHAKNCHFKQKFK